MSPEIVCAQKSQGLLPARDQMSVVKRVYLQIPRNEAKNLCNEFVVNSNRKQLFRGKSTTAGRVSTRPFLFLTAEKGERKGYAERFNG